MTGYIEMKFIAGDCIEKAAESAQKVADNLETTIQFRFNDTDCVAYPGGMPDRLVSEYKRVNSARPAPPYKFASSK